MRPLQRFTSARWALLINLALCALAFPGCVTPANELWGDDDGYRKDHTTGIVLKALI